MNAIEQAITKLDAMSWRAAMSGNEELNSQCQNLRDSLEKIVDNFPGLYLDWLADELDRTADPQRINTIKRVAGNVRALAGI